MKIDVISKMLQTKTKNKKREFSHKCFSIYYFYTTKNVLTKLRNAVFYFLQRPSTEVNESANPDGRVGILVCVLSLLP